MSRAAEILVVGGGVIGLSIARALAMRGGQNIRLIERHALGREASFAAAGILAPQAEADTKDAFFELSVSSRDLYPKFAQELNEDTGLDIQLDTTGTLFAAFTEKDQHEIEERFAWQSRAGLAVEKLTAVEARELEPYLSENVITALRFPQDIQVENRRLITALARSCEQHGVSMATKTAVSSIRTTRGRVDGVETNRGFFPAGKVVIAGGAWTSLIEGLADIPIEPVKGQMLCFGTDPNSFRHVTYSCRGYLVPRHDGRLLAGSTTEHVGFDKAVTLEATSAIRSHALELSNKIANLAMLEAWAGLRPRATDSLPVLGPCGENEGLFIATGHYRNGILLAPITGELMADLILDKKSSALMTAFGPERFGLVAAN